MNRQRQNKDIAALSAAVEKLPTWFSRKAKGMLTHPDYRVREAAIHAIGRCRARKYIPALITALHERANNDYALQVAAVEALGLIGETSILPHLMVEMLDGELLNVRRAARHQIDRLLSAHALRGRQGFGKSQDDILNDKTHPCPVGSDSIHARQIDEQVRLTQVTVPVLYETPAFCRYAAGQRPILERGMDALLAKTAPEAEVVRTTLTWLTCGMASPSSKSRRDFAAWWNKAAKSISLRSEWEEEAILAGGTGSCDMVSRCLVALCRTRQIPGRLVIWYHANDKRQHVMAEFFVGGRWLLSDPLFGFLWNYTAWDLLCSPDLATEAKRLRPKSEPQQADLDWAATPQMFSQAGIVPTDRM